MPDEYKKFLEGKKQKYFEAEKLKDFLPELDVLYVTRVQKERFATKEEYESVKDFYVISKDTIEKAKKDLKIMHPLPRITEIETALDDTRYAVYFHQVANGIPVRQAILSLYLKSVK